jgi:hypothetical protein
MQFVKHFCISLVASLAVFLLALTGSSTAMAGSSANPAGQTIIPSNACAADLLGKKMSCTSQDITIADARLVSENFDIPTSCVAGETILVEFEVDIQMNANANRYDPLLFVALTEADIKVPAADPVNNPNLCWLSSLSDIDDSPFLLDLEATEAYGENVAASAQDQDALDSCPDVTNDGSDPVIVQRMSTTMQAELPCIDTDGDGFMNFQAMITWTTGADTISQCGSGDGVLDSTEFSGQTSKCSTNIGNSIALEIIDPASLTVVKNTTGDGAFTFTTSGFDSASVFSNSIDSFVLNTTAGTASLTDADIDVPSEGLGFSVAETVPPGFELTSAVCSNAQDPATLTLFPGDDVTCTFVNVAEGSVTIVKNTIGADGDQFSFTSDMPDGDFNITTDGFTGQHVESLAVPAGTYSVTEADPSGIGVGYDLTDVTCLGGSEGTSGNTDTGTATIVVSAQDSITCTFTNTAQGTIIVEKSTFPETATDTFNFTGDAAGDIGEGEQIVVGNLVPGTYSSTETPLTGWDLTEISCDDGNSIGNTGTGEATFNLEAGETVTCVFTNTQRGSIEVVKQVLPVGANAQAFTVNAGGGFFFDGIGGSQIAQDLTPASDVGNATTGAIEVLPSSLYTVSETMPAGWFEAATPTCNDGSDPLTGIEVQPGEAVVCTFVNNAYGHILVDKVTDPADSPQSFTFTPSYGADFNLTDADTPNDSGELVPGEYSVSEALPAGWLATSATCDNGDTPDAITLDAGETVTCTFVNTEEVIPPVEPMIPVPVNSTFALFLLTLMMLATGWYFRPAGMRKF